MGRGLRRPRLFGRPGRRRLRPPRYRCVPAWSEERLRAGLPAGYHAHLDAGEPLPAVRSAFFLALELFTTGEPAVAPGWASRAARLLDEHGADVVERGYLLVHATFRHIVAAKWDEAITVDAQVTEYGRRFRDPDLLAMGLPTRVG